MSQSFVQLFIWVKRLVLWCHIEWANTLKHWNLKHILVCYASFWNCKTICNCNQNCLPSFEANHGIAPSNLWKTNLWNFLTSRNWSIPILHSSPLVPARAASPSLPPVRPPTKKTSYRYFLMRMRTILKSRVRRRKRKEEDGALSHIIKQMQMRSLKRFRRIGNSPFHWTSLVMPLVIEICTQCKFLYLPKEKG